MDWTATPGGTAASSPAPVQAPPPDPGIPDFGLLTGRVNARERCRTVRKRIGTESTISRESVFVPYNRWGRRRCADASRLSRAGLAGRLDLTLHAAATYRLPQGRDVDRRARSVRPSPSFYSAEPCHVAALRTHRRRSDGRPQCEPLQRQDQAALPALVSAYQASVRCAGQGFRLKITNAALRTLDYRGGLDVFLLKAHDETLSPRALKIKRQVKAKLAAADAPAV